MYTADCRCGGHVVLHCSYATLISAVIFCGFLNISFIPSLRKSCARPWPAVTSTVGLSLSAVRVLTECFLSQQFHRLIPRRRADRAALVRGGCVQANRRGADERCRRRLTISWIIYQLNVDSSQQHRATAAAAAASAIRS